jgi:hypothetical protein
MTIHTATYSPEDNKLRLYASSRLDDELYQRVKGAGFKWAPRQELFVAPKWTPEREDLCIELAGTIEAEQTTLVERAEAKAERLDNLSAKRESDSNAYTAAAHRISERFAGGQPILMGHHSQRSAERDRDRMDNEMRKAKEAADAVQYWNWKAEGVERYANMKNCDRTRMNRIKTLLADLRSIQRDINHGFIVNKLWTDISAETDAEKKSKLAHYYAGARLETGPTGGWDTWSQLDKGEITEDEVIERGLRLSQRLMTSANRMRWISHILNRLAYERAELGPIKRFEGELKATTLQTFARTQGAHKPKAQKTSNGWTLMSTVPLPAHVGDGIAITLSSDQWIDLMEAVGYEVPEVSARAAKPPLLNLDVESIEAQMYGRLSVYPRKEMTKAEYSNIHNDHKGTRLSTCGKFRFRTAYRDGGLNFIFLTDSKVHPTPESDSIKAAA